MSFRKTIQAVIISIAIATTVVAQSSDDPVSRAMKRIDAAVEPRASAAERVIEASRFVSNSTTARKQGEREQAIESLKKAEAIISETRPPQTSFLLEALSLRIAAERLALDPKPIGLQPQLSARSLFRPSFSRTAFAKLDEYRSSLGHILEEENVPVELLSVAMVESSFNPMALSPKGARGIWQFMPATAARYGLTVQPGNDHRTHPEHSTRAAARYLRDLYNQFGDWKLALAAYNSGEARVQRIIDLTGIRSFDEMSRRRLLPAETRNYVPAVLAMWSMLAATSNQRRQL